MGETTVRPRDITAALRHLIPGATLAVKPGGQPGEFLATMPLVSAQRIGVFAADGGGHAGLLISRLLDRKVHVTASRGLRHDVRYGHQRRPGVLRGLRRRRVRAGGPDRRRVVPDLGRGELPLRHGSPGRPVGHHLRGGRHLPGIPAVTRHAWPPEIAHLAVCPKRKLPIPFINEIRPDGAGAFAVLDEAKARECLAGRLCAMCGLPMGWWVAFFGDEASLKEGGVFIEPPVHERCAEIAAVDGPHGRRRLHGRGAGHGG